MIYIVESILTIQYTLFTQNNNQMYEMENIFLKQIHFDNEGKILKPNII